MADGEIRARVCGEEGLQLALCSVVGVVELGSAKVECPGSPRPPGADQEVELRRSDVVRPAQVVAARRAVQGGCRGWLMPLAPSLALAVQFLRPAPPTAVLNEETADGGGGGVRCSSMSGCWGSVLNADSVRRRR